MSNKAVRGVDHESDVLWHGHPWVVPAFIGDTMAAIAVAAILTWFELTFGFAFLSVSSVPILFLTYVGILIVWGISIVGLLLVRASTSYALRNSSLEISRGIIGKRVFTLSAAGFSDLEVLQGPLGRLLNTGDIVMETDSHRDLRLRKVRGPMEVSAMIRRVMTVPMVRVATGMPVVEEKTR